MRQIKFWHRGLRKQIQAAWNDSNGRQSAERLCTVELGLFACEMLIPDEDPKSLWVLVTGYSLNTDEIAAWNDEQRRARAALRHLLPYYRGPYAWEEELNWYVEQPDYIRGYEVQNGCVSRRNTSVAPQRFELYAQALSEPPPLSERKLDWAQTGDYVFYNGRRAYDVTIPETWIGDSYDSYPMKSRPPRDPLIVPWEELVETACWMDEQATGQNYAERLNRIRLETWVDNGFHQASQLHVSGLLHLVGMLSSGKTTLMQILTVWAVKKGQHVTLVLGDVVSVLEWAALFVTMGIHAAPVIGGYNRERHLNRLHRVESEQNPDNPLHLRHTAFQWMGTVCALNGTLPDPAILEPRLLPCTRLQKPDEIDFDRPKYYACPLYHRCGVHRAQRDMVTARVWVATPASLVYTRVPSQVNPVSMRLGELVSQHSDLVLVDEADRVQTQLDATFSPSEILAGTGGDPWLNQLGGAVETQIRRAGRRTLGVVDVESWMTVQRNTQLATDKLYALFLQKPTDLEEMQQDYFTGWTVWEGLVSEILSLKGLSVSEKNANSTYKQQMQTFNDYVNAPLGHTEDGVDPILARLQERVRTLLTDHSLTAAFPRVQSDLKALFPEVNADDTQWNTWTVQFTFALIAGVLSWGVDYLTRNWELVERPLDLEDRNTSLFYNPPKDYDASIPAAPMGNVLAFQYSTSTEDEAGVLRFFRISGVGRAWLLNLHQLFKDEGKPGPNVILLSGTSWAGDSPLYHLQYPVGGVLRAPDEEVNAIADRSRFIQDWVIDHDTDRFIQISGTHGANRSNAFDQLVKHFTQPTGPTNIGPSRFEQERNQLPQSRQRLLILVGSYAEAAYVRQSIERARPTWIGKVLSLVRDDDSPVDSWVGSSASLQRGQVGRFAQTDAWILVAPLLAVERGHNILNESGHAAIGAAYFWVRPHPRPDDLTLPIAAINAWAIEQGAKEWGRSLLDAGENFRRASYAKWRHWLQVPWIYSTLDTNERDMVTWTQLVTIWQVVGRLVRGGSPARVHFVDAAFRSRYRPAETEDEDEQVLQPGLLAEMRRVLKPYFTDNGSVDPFQRALVQTLYQPFYTALSTLGDI